MINGVLRDGKENTATPTQNTIVVDPGGADGLLHGHERGAVHREGHQLGAPARRHAALPAAGALLAHADASIFVTGTDLFLLTNYTGLDPIVNGNTAAVGGSGGVGIDYGNFPVPRGLNFGFRMGF